jgi:hypothetical protein
MMTVKTSAFDAGRHLQSRKAQAELLRDALESGEAGFIATSLGVIARAPGMAHVASEAHDTTWRHQSAWDRIVDAAGQANEVKGNPQGPRRRLSQSRRVQWMS